jgi:hypothetical protein
MTIAVNQLHHQGGARTCILTTTTSNLSNTSHPLHLTE